MTVSTTEHALQLSPAELLVHSLNQLLEQFEQKLPVRLAHFDNAQRALAALPLTTEEYSQASANLRNAKDYLHYNERGAAHYELLTAQGRVKRIVDADVVVPRRGVSQTGQVGRTTSRQP